MDEGSRDQDTRAEVSRYEEELVGNGYRRKALDDHGEGASCETVSSALEGMRRNVRTRSAKCKY